MLIHHLHQRSLGGIQMNLNHVLVLTTDLAEMKFFWTELIGLEVGDRPSFPFSGFWLYSDGKPLVHIAERSCSERSSGAIAHVAFDGTDYSSLLARLNKSYFLYTEKIVPQSGERQVFVMGPDGLTVEMLFPMSEAELLTEENGNKHYKANDNLEFLGSKKL